MHTGETISTSERVLTENILALRKYPRIASYALAGLEDVYAQLGCIPEISKAVIREYFNVASFPDDISESLFHATPTNTQIVRICAGPLCIQADSDKLATKLIDTYTTFPGIAIERQHCMGACHSAPVAKMNGTLLLKASFEKIQQQTCQTGDKSTSKS